MALKWSVLLRRLALLGLLIWSVVGVSNVFKPLPEGLGQSMPIRDAEDVRLLTDLTWIDAGGVRQTDHVIFDHALRLIEGAEKLVLLDMFLFNEFAGNSNAEDMRELSGEIAAALIERKRQRPDMPVVLITDPLNTLYGGIINQRIDEMEEQGVEVVLTRLDDLRDSNPLWSGIWRLCCGWTGNSTGGGWLPNPVGEQKVPLRSVLALLNFKANHRKTLVVDSGEGWTGLVTSANPHDASSAHSNVAVVFSGPAALDLLETERAVLRFSRPELVRELDWPQAPEPNARNHNAGGTRIQVLTEGAIRDHVEALFEQAVSGDTLDLSMFYLAHRGVLDRLKAAAARGVDVRVLLDANGDAFGRKKDGIPNQPVAEELMEAGIPVRWCVTRGEQCHDKFLLYRSGNGAGEIIAGSANLTRRNLDNLNLETNVRVSADGTSAILRDSVSFFEDRWNNRGGRVYSLPYEANAHEGWLRYWRYRVMEATGLSTF